MDIFACWRGAQKLALTSSSNHPGGINILLVDGSVRFVRETLAYEAWRALGSRNGGEIVSAGDW